MEVRRRRIIEPIPLESHTKLLENFDVFTKLPDDCKKSTSAGGAITLLTVVSSCVLIFSEVRNYITPQFIYSYEVDRDFESKVRINIDLTLATKCEYTSLDLLDVTGSTVDPEEKVRYWQTTFELDESKRKLFEMKRDFTNIMRSQHRVLPDISWSRKFSGWFSHSYNDGEGTALLGGSFRPTKVDRYDACHISATLHVRKVAGNMHLIPGKPLLGLGGAHLHVAPMLDLSAFNFSHRINHLSFGEPVANRLNPLDAIEQISLTPMESFQYYVSIVPTRIVYAFSTLQTYQYAVTIKNRTINHNEGSHGMPGIFFTYETFPLVVEVAESRELFGTFLARLAELVGGLFATIGFLQQLVYGFPQVVLNSRTGRRWQSGWHRFLRGLHGSKAGGESKDICVAPLNPDSPT